MSLVYSTDPKDKCPKCQQLKNACKCPPDNVAGIKSTNFTAVLRIEKAGRGGKTVTVIDQLPKNDPFLKQITKELKNLCGAGGSYKMDGRDGLIEIQGDQRERIRKHLLAKNFKVKG